MVLHPKMNGLRQPSGVQDCKLTVVFSDDDTRPFSAFIRWSLECCLAASAMQIVSNGRRTSADRSIELLSVVRSP
jgi:hypothetical protein